MKKQRIKQSLYRILMSEVLPYELPLLITNNRFFQIADKLRLTYQNGKLVYKRHLSQENVEWADAFVKLLNGSGTKKSFNYYINKADVKDKDNNFKKKARELVIVHPLLQMRVLELYKKYDSLILNFCSKSSFSLRYPDKRATFLRPKSNLPKAAEDFLDYKANDNPKHYFHYRKYQNINAFYEGREFQRMESRFKYMFKSDIHHCFDEIPIDELPQMLYKTVSAETGNNHFGGQFYQLMREMNSGRANKKPSRKALEANEDVRNSILIGPEFSRLFAEMFLQQIDTNIELGMSSGYEQYQVHKDYECFRYVDDIFFFYNDKSVFSKFYGILNTELHLHGMKLNGKEKSYIETTPVIKGLSIAKRELRLVVEKILENRLQTAKGLILREDHAYYEFPLKMKAQYAIIDIKTIISSNDVGLYEVSASMLAYLHRKLGKALDEIDSLMNAYLTADADGLLDQKGKSIWRGYEMDMVYYFREIIKLLFYVFNNDMRMNTGIRVLGILNMILSFCQGTLFQKEKATSKAMSVDAKNKIYKSIVDELIFILRHNKIQPLNGLEISNLMLILLNIPCGYRIDNSIWEHFLDDAFHEYGKDNKVNFLSALTLLMIFGHSDSNPDVKDDICGWFLDDLKKHDWDIDNVECLLIMTSMMTSPYVDKVYKDKILNGVAEDFRKALEAISKRRSPFMQWDEFRLAKACQMKYSAEVY